MNNLFHIGKEETNGSFPFKHNNDFEMIITIHGDEYKVEKLFYHLYKDKLTLKNFRFSLPAYIKFCSKIAKKAKHAKSIFEFII